MEQSAGQKLITHKQTHQPEESRQASAKCISAEVERRSTQHKVLLPLMAKIAEHSSEKEIKQCSRDNVFA